MEEGRTGPIGSSDIDDIVTSRCRFQGPKLNWDEMSILSDRLERRWEGHPTSLYTQLISLIFPRDRSAYENLASYHETQ
jgi:hypothetical protein